MKYYIPFTDEEERVCIRQSQGGDKHAFGRLVEKYQGRLKGFCIGNLGCNFDGAEDIMQEAFCKAWKSIRTFNYDSRFSTWLCTIAKNHYLNICKDSDNKAESFDENNFNAEGTPSYDIVMQDCVEKQLGKIRVEYRDVIELVHLRDMSYEDAAHTLRWPLGTVKKRLHMALKEAGPLLRECL
jgi:RNA polymerase sigma-70 factor (ECF subfamily)